MARLNEVPPAAAASSVESIELLKRRWLKQNRDLAKSHQNQAINIRALHAELSCLKAENLQVREEKILLEHQHARERRRFSLEPIDRLKKQLDSKVTELQDLLSGFSSIRENLTSTPPRERRTSGHSPAFTSNPRKWKNSLSLSDIANSLEGHLDPILEDVPSASLTEKRRSLSERLRQIGPMSPSCLPRPTSPSLSASPSPPPPRNWLTHGFGSLDDAPDPPVNFEIRRRRKDGAKPSSPEVEEAPTAGLTEEVADVAESPSSPASPKAMDPDSEPAEPRISTSPLQSPPSKRIAVDHGRTLHARLTLQKVGVPKDSVVESAVDRRRKLPGQPRARLAKREQDENVVSIDQQLSSVKDGAAEKDKIILPIRRGSGMRKPLGPKSVNQDLSSPVKAAAPKQQPLKGRAGPSKAPSMKPDEQKEKTGSSSIQINPDDSEKAKLERSDKDIEVEVQDPVEPETPLPGDILSPASTLAPTSTRSAGTRDTPPPRELNPLTSTADALTSGRPSRRTRTAVSYAQPNLRDKMRRPTEQLANAVIEPKPCVAKPEAAATTMTTMELAQHSKSAIVKDEKNDGDGEATEANPQDRLYATLKANELLDGSPLRTREPAPPATAPASSSTEQQSEVIERPRSVPPGALRTGEKAVKPLRLPGQERSARAKALERSQAGDLSIFEFPGSSPGGAEEGAVLEHKGGTEMKQASGPKLIGRRLTVGAGVKENAVGRRVGRVSSAVVAADKADEAGVGAPEGAGEVASGQGEGLLGSRTGVTTRRRSMMI